MKTDIKDLDDIKNLVDTFYNKVRDNDLLAPIFNERIKDTWPHHLEKMYRFWQTILLDEHTYSGTPFVPHATMPIGGEHFENWLTLFHETLDELYQGPIAENAKWRANKMADLFQIKLDYIRQSGHKPLI